MIEKLKHETEMIEDLEKSMPSESFQRNWYIAYNYELCNKINELVEVSNIHIKAFKVLAKTLDAMGELINSNCQIVDELMKLHPKIEVNLKDKTDD